MANNFCTINYDIRDSLEITNNQYIVCDIANRMSQKEGWTFLSREEYAKSLGVSEQGILDLLKVCIKKDLVERHPTKFAFKATRKWIENAVEINVKGKGKETLPAESRVKKLDPQGKETLPNRVKKLDPQGKETCFHIEDNYIYNDNITIKNTDKEYTLENFENLEDKKENVYPPIPPPPPIPKTVIVQEPKTELEFIEDVFEISEGAMKLITPERIERYKMNYAIYGFDEKNMSAYIDATVTQYMKSCNMSKILRCNLKEIESAFCRYSNFLIKKVNEGIKKSSATETKPQFQQQPQTQYKDLSQMVKDLKIKNQERWKQQQ